MSDETNTNVTNANESAKPTPKRKPRTGKSTFSVNDMARARLRKRGIKSDERMTDEAKVVRGILRSSAWEVAKADASVRKSGRTKPNARIPWPTNMGKKVFEAVVNGKR